MIQLTLPPKARQTIEAALRRSGHYEVGGILMAEHVGPNAFVVRDLTVHRRGTIFNFVRQIDGALRRLRAFFQSADNDYTRFNYIGEWHSHPRFDPVPSGRDDSSMREIVQDPNVSANFVVLLIVKFTDDQLIGTVHTYLPDGSKHNSTLAFGEVTDSEHSATAKEPGQQHL